MPASSRPVATAEVLADYVHGLDAGQVSDAAMETVARCLLDTICAAAAAQDNPGVRAAQRAAPGLHGTGEAAIWFTGSTGAAGAALLANSAAAAALDLDDGNRQARGHPGAAVIPAALAVSAAGPARTDDASLLALAIVAGYEVGIRVAMGRSAYAPSGAWSPFAVIAAAGRLAGDSPHALAQAFGIAAQTAPAFPALAGIAGTDVKEGIPMGSMSGLGALLLAREGYTGPAGILDDPRHFSSDRVLDGLGDEALITRTYFKPFGCCRHIHGPLDAFRSLQHANGFSGTEVADIEVHTYAATFNLTNFPHPADLVQAQYSVPHCLAVLAWHGDDALLPLRDAHLDDADVNALAGRVAVRFDPQIESLFPARSPARVTVALKDGRRFESPLTDPRGDPSDPLDWEQLCGKFRAASAHTLNPGQQDAVIDGVLRFREGDAGPLRRALAAKAGLVR